MLTIHDFKRVLKPAARIVRNARVRPIVNQLHLVNERSSSPIVRLGGPVVSLTSYGKRIDTVYLAIESIAAGDILPSELVLWIDEESRFRSCPITLERLKQRGLSIRSCNNFGPHTKYYPYVESAVGFPVPLVTADDDILYPKAWLADLVKAYNGNPNNVNCHRARLITFDGDRIAPYMKWPLCKSTTANWRHFLNGVSGVIYPPDLLVALKKAGPEFQRYCPKADDVWLHATALRSGFPVAQVAGRSALYPTIPESQDIALFHTNMETGNDIQIEKTYDEFDRARMLEV